MSSTSNDRPPPSPAASVVHSSTKAIDSSDQFADDDDDDEEEYEEVEEEIEVEEEVEEEEEVDQVAQEQGHGLGEGRFYKEEGIFAEEEEEEEEEADGGENNVDAADSPVVGDYGGIGNKLVHDGQGPDSHDKEATTDAKISSHIPKEHLLLSGNASSHLGQSTFNDLASSRLCHVSGESTNGAVPLENEEVNVSHPTQVQSFEKQSNELYQNAQRSFIFQERLPSLSPSANFKDGTIRSAIICDFFAKGWCIKGKSCRFLHQRHHKGDGIQKLEGNIAFAKSEFQFNGGLVDISKESPSSAPLNQQDLLGPDDGSHSVVGKLALDVLEKDKHALLEQGALASHLSCNSQRSPSRRDGSRLMSLIKEYGEDTQADNITAVEYYSYDLSIKSGDSVSSGRFRLGEYGSLITAFGVSSISHTSGGLFSCSRDWDEIMGKQSRYMSHDCSSPFGPSLDQHHMSSLRNPCSSYSYLKASAYKDREVSRSSLLHNSSPIPGSDAEKVPCTYNIKDQLFSRYRSEFIPYNWEPSIPFRPSYLFPSLRTPASQYDPLRDSIEQPDGGNTPSRLLAPSKALFFHGTPSGQVDESGSLPAAEVSESMVDKNLVESHSHQKLKDSDWDKTSHGSSKDVPMAEAESAATSVTAKRNRDDTPEGEIPKCVKDKRQEVRTDCGIDPKSQSNNTRLNKAMKMIKDVRSGMLEVDEYEEMHRQLKAMKCFRASVVEFVKELMKPFWHEGNLSKDAYKVIVQKVEEKVVGSLLPSQVPNTAELAKQYLTSSRPKILNLIEGYVEKYGKL